MSEFIDSISSSELGSFVKLKDDVQQAFLFMDIDIKHLIEFRDRVKESLALGKQSDDATIGEIHNLKTERSYYRGVLDHLCDRLQLWANGFERLKDVSIVKTSESENLAIDNRRPCSFSRRVNVLLGDNPDDILTVLDNDQMLARIEKMYNDFMDANEFRDQVVAALGNPDDLIAQIKELAEIKTEIALGNIGKLSSKAPRYDPQEVPEVCDDSDYDTKDREIERLKRCISGIASFLDLPSDAKQPDICQAIMELREKYKKLSREPLSNEQIIIADLRHDLLVSQKVIARLVGE